MAGDAPQRPVGCSLTNPRLKELVDILAELPPSTVADVMETAICRCNVRNSRRPAARRLLQAFTDVLATKRCGAVHACAWPAGEPRRDAGIGERLEAATAQRRALLAERAARDVHDGIYYCADCLENRVYPERGEHACPACRAGGST